MKDFEPSCASECTCPACEFFLGAIDLDGDEDDE